MNWRAIVESLWRKAKGLGDESSAEALAVAGRLPSGFSRRSFLKGALAVSALAAVVDVDQALWTKSKTIFLPPAPTLATEEEIAAFENSFATPQWVTHEALKLLDENLKLSNRAYDIDQPMKIGQTVTVRRPDRWMRDGNELVIQNVGAKSVELMHHIGISLDPKALQACKTADEASEKVIRPAVDQLATQVRAHKMDVFGRQALPTTVESAHVVSSRKTGLSLRSVKFYDPAPGEPPKGTLYLDILGGSSGLQETE